MPNVLYTTIDSIRSTIGVDENDLSDQMVLDQNLDLQMMVQLATILPNYESVSDSSETKEFALKLWCQYFGALQLLTDSRLGIAQKLQANNDSMTRFAVDFDKLAENLATKLSALETLLGATTSADTVVQHGIFGISTPGYNPITGE